MQLPPFLHTLRHTRALRAEIREFGHFTDTRTIYQSLSEGYTVNEG